MTAEEFLKRHKSRQKESKIAPYLQDIIKLREAGLSYNDILDFLRLNQVDVSYAALSLYLRRHAPAELLPPKKTQPVKTQAKEKSNPQPPSPIPQGASSTSASSAPGILAKKKKPEVSLDFLEEE